MVPAPGPASRLGDLDVAVPMTARLGRVERRAYHRRQLANLEALAVENAAAQFSLEAIESLVGTVRQLQAVVRQQLDNRADAAVEADRLCVLLQRDAGGSFSPALSLAVVIRARL